MKAKPQQLYVYVLVRPDRCKIGHSRAPTSRGRNIASQAGFDDVELRIAFPVAPSLASEIEQAAHDQLAAKRLHGEWFAVPAAPAVGAVEQALLKVTRKHALAPHSFAVRRRHFALDLSTPEGKAIFRQRLAKLRAGDFDNRPAT